MKVSALIVLFAFAAFLGTTFATHNEQDDDLKKIVDAAHTELLATGELEQIFTENLGAAAQAHLPRNRPCDGNFLVDNVNFASRAASILLAGEIRWGLAPAFGVNSLFRAYATAITRIISEHHNTFLSATFTTLGSKYRDQIRALDDGVVDILVGATIFTRDRQDSNPFSCIWLDTPINSIRTAREPTRPLVNRAQLNEEDVYVGVIKGSIAEEVVVANLPDAKLKRFDSEGDLFASVGQSSVHLIVHDEVAVTQWLDANAGCNCRAQDFLQDPVGYALVLTVFEFSSAAAVTVSFILTLLSLLFVLF